jgi:HK97 family phage major capsid protein
MTKLEELTAQFHAKQDALGEALRQAKQPDGRYDLLKSDLLKDCKTQPAAVERFRELEKELDELADELKHQEAMEARDRKVQGLIEERKQISKPMQHPGGAGGTRDVPAQKSLGELFIEHGGHKKQGAIGPDIEIADFDLKVLLETSTGFAPETTRTAYIEMFRHRPLQIIELMPTAQTSQMAIVYMEETTSTNAAAETAEGGTKPEAELAFTEKTSPVRKIPVWLPVTDEQLEDVPFLQNFIDSRLRFFLEQRLDGQILVGNGVAPNLRGIINTVGIQTQAKGADPTPDAIYKAMVKVRVTGRALPNAVAMHSNDWTDIRLLKTTDGVYIWGPPMDPGPERIWGIPVALNEALTENTALVGDFNYAQLVYRRGISTQVTNSHADFFIKNLQAIRAEMRVAVVVYRPTAFCTVTGV